MAFSDKILLLRKQRAWSQEQLAEELNVSRQAVSKWESGLAMPDLAKLREISELFNLTLDDLVNDKTLPSPPTTQLNAPQKPAQGGNECVAPGKKRFPPWALWFAAGAVVLAVAVAAIIFWPSAQPDYTRPEGIAEYLIDTIDLRQPYSQIYLNELYPEQIRTQMENDGIRVTVANDVLEQARRLFVDAYFLSFEEHGLRYDVEEDALYCNGKSVAYFEDYSIESTLARVAWIGESDGMVVVVVERNHRGDVVLVDEIPVFE